MFSEFKLSRKTCQIEKNDNLQLYVENKSSDLTEHTYFSETNKTEKFTASFNIGRYLEFLKCPFSTSLNNFSAIDQY